VSLRRNRAFLAPWQPLRPDDFYTVKGQQESVAQALVQHEAGNSLPLVIVDHRADVAGTVTLQSIIRGAFQSCSVGYWLAEDAQGRGLATQALRGCPPRLPRSPAPPRPAETLVHNLRSQRVLDRLDFARYGLAPAYLKIAGQWQDNLLYQLLTPAPELVGVA